ncbi:MAG: hypothetical protein U5N86_00370 [Planctomycetota bacterium]|nr:hypothetical protein [Planctomycetota bacterium]
MDIDVVGPLGNGFTVSRSYEDILLVGGGVGAAELVLLAKQLNAQGRPARFICGAGTKQDLVHLDRIREHCREVVVTTEDGSDGETGIVTGPLERMLGEGGVDIVAACGPDGMLKAVAEMALENETESLVATEERMACGIGACFGCTVPLMVNGRLKMARACKDGPVFRGKAFIEGAKHEASRES